MAHWHGLAKLRIHTDRTLEILDQTTTLLGQYLRDFHSKTCSSFNTKELPREANARDRRKTKKNTKDDQNSAKPDDTIVHPVSTIPAPDVVMNSSENATVASSSTCPSGIIT